MDSFRQAKFEIQSAERAIFKMKEAKSFDEFEDAWKNYLNNVEKCWKKVERICQPVKNKFQPWQGKFVRLRRQDMLLKYLFHARNADQHSIQEIIEHKPGHYSFIVPSDIYGDVYIENFEVGIDGRVKNYIGTVPPIISETPPKIELLKLKNRNGWYYPPTQHLNKKLEQEDPISVAQKGLEFYKQFLEEAVRIFADALPSIKT